MKVKRVEHYCDICRWSFADNEIVFKGKTRTRLLNGKKEKWNKIELCDKCLDKIGYMVRVEREKNDSIYM